MNDAWIDSALISNELLFREQIGKGNALNFNVPVTAAHLDQHLSIKNALNKLAKYEVTSEHLLRIIGSWHLHQYLVKVSTEANLPRLKKKIGKVVKDIKKINQELYDGELTMFTILGVNYSCLYTGTAFDQLVAIFNRKSGSPFNKDKIIKHAFFELIFIAEMLGITPPTQNYESSQFKSYLKIFLDSLGIKEKSLEYYYQEYVKAKKSNPHILCKIEALAKLSAEFYQDVSKWEIMLTIYREQISPILIPK